MAGIGIRGLSKSYGGDARLAAVADLSLDIADGQFVTLLGPSGCGKTTLLKLVSGLLSPTSGSVLLGGQPVTGPGAERGVVFQSYTLFPWLTIEENVAFGLREKGIAATRQLAKRQLTWLRSFPALEPADPDALRRALGNAWS